MYDYFGDMCLPLKLSKVLCKYVCKSWKDNFVTICFEHCIYIKRHIGKVLKIFVMFADICKTLQPVKLFLEEAKIFGYIFCSVSFISKVEKFKNKINVTVCMCLR